MKSIVYLTCVLVVMGLAFWAYRENYRTQAAMSEMSDVQREIAGLREELGVLRAEWAYLNRPTRLRELVDLNFDRLQLVPLEPDHFVDLDNVDYPKPPPVRPPSRPEMGRPDADAVSNEEQP